MPTTTIRVSAETRDLLKESKPYDSMSYDDLLRAAFEGEQPAKAEI
jgi:hypothetical protein